MSDRMTSIHLPGTPNGAGYADWGRKTPKEMIATIRAHAAYQKEWADAVLAAPDEAFQVETYVGVHVKKNREVIQSARNALTP